MTQPRAPFVLSLCFALSGVALPARAQSTCPSWSPGFHVAGADGPVRAFAELDEGAGPRLFAGGDFVATGDVVVGRVARFDGISWSALGGGVDGPVHALLARAEPGGAVLYAGGAFTHADGIAASRVARWDGASWSALGAGLPGLVRVLCEYDDGSGSALYAGGEFAGAIARWNGAQWTILGPGLSGGLPNYVTALAVYQDGGGSALYAGGQFRSAGGTFLDNVARWDGSSWSSPLNGISGTVRALTVFDDGGGPRLFAGGTFAHAGGVNVASVARWDGTAWSAAGSLSNVASFSIHDDGSGVRLHAVTNQSTLHSLRAWNGTSWSVTGPTIARVQVVRSFDDGGGARLYAGGDFTPSSTLASFHIARLGTGAWEPPTPTGQGLGGQTYCMAAHDDGSGPALYLSGGLQSVASAPPQPGILRWNGTTWSTVPAPPSVAYALASYDGGGPALYASTFGSPGYEFAVTRWDGNAWSVVGGIAASWEYVNRLTALDDATGRALYAGGSFTNIYPAVGGPVAASRVARWDGANWSGFGAGPATDDVFAVAVYDDGLGAGPALYAGGVWSASFHGLARWNGTSWVDVGGGVDGTVEDMLVHDDGSGPQLYACGTFANAGGAPARSIARWNGTAWSSVGGGVIPTLGVAFTRVNTLATFDEGTGAGTRLFAQCIHPTPGGADVGALVRWDGGAWSIDGIEITGALAQFTLPAALLVPVQGASGAELWCGGAVREAGGVASFGIARLRACDSTGARFCAGDGSATSCPCGNASAPGTIAGCVNSIGRAGALSANGLASVGIDSLVLRGSGMTNGACLYFQGSTRVNGGAGVAFGDGLRCAGGAIVRLGLVQNALGASQFPRATDPRVSVVGGVRAGDLRHYQVWYRDAASFCTSATWNLTNGLSIGWGG